MESVISVSFQNSWSVKDLDLDEEPPNRNLVSSVHDLIFRYSKNDDKMACTVMKLDQVIQRLNTALILRIRYFRHFVER